MEGVDLELIIGKDQERKRDKNQDSSSTLTMAQEITDQHEDEGQKIQEIVISL